MKEYTIEDLSENYNLDLNLAVDEIISTRAKMVLIQFPEGLKQYAVAVVDYLETKTSAKFIIYLGSCFGACDTPVGMEKTGIDLMVQFGHNSLMPKYLR